MEQRPCHAAGDADQLRLADEHLYELGAGHLRQVYGAAVPDFAYSFVVGRDGWDLRQELPRMN